MAASSNNAVIGALRVEATLDAGKFISGAARIRKESKQTEATVKKSFLGMGAAMKAGIAGFVGTLSVGYFTSIIKSALDYAGSLGEIASTLGVTTRQLQTYRFVAGQVGVSQEKLELGLKKLNLSLGQAKLGAEAPKKAFGELSKIIGQDIVKASEQGGDALPLVADGIAKIGDRSKSAAIEAAIFGAKSGPQLHNFLALGSKGVNELAAAYEKLGVVLTEEQIRKADEAADTVNKLNEALNAQIAGVVADNARAIYDLANSIIHLVAQLPNAIRGLRNFYANFLDFTATVTQKVDQVIESPINRFNPLTAPFRGGVLHANRVANVLADRAEAGKVRRDILAAQVGALPILPPELQHGKLPRGADVGQFLAPGGGKAKKGPEDQSADAIAQVMRQQLQADAEVLRAKQQLATSAVERSQIELKLIEIDRQTQAMEIDDQVRRAQKDAADGRITKDALREVVAQAAILKEKNDQVARLKAQAVKDERARQEEQDAFEASAQTRQFAIDNLHFADQMAETQAEHRRIQLEILDAEIEQKRLELEHEKQLAIRNGATAQEIQAIQDRIDHLPVERAQGAAGVVKNTQGPLEGYLDSLPHTADKMNEALQNLEVQGLQGVVDALSHVGEGWKAMRDIALQTINDILQQLIKLQLEKLLFNIIGTAAGGFDSASFNATVASNAAHGFATGGSMILGGRAGVDKNLLSMNGLPIARVSYGERLSISNDNSRGGSAAVPAFIFNNYAKMSAKEARDTGMQAAAGWQAQMAKARTKGIGG